MTNSDRIYWDHNSTTPCVAEVLAEMLPYFAVEYGNSGSPHNAGRVAASAVAEARDRVAHAIGTDSENVVFTSGATESNNLAILGIAAQTSERRKIVVGAIEHKSVLGPAFHLSNKGYEVRQIPVDRNGLVDLYAAETIIDGHTLLVSVQGANNETGVIQPLQDIVSLAHARGAFFHCDATQMLGKIPISIDDSSIDMASFSAHKAYGPKGVGALAITSGRLRAALRPLHLGGGQERSLRPGTQNVPGIVGFGSACCLIHKELDVEIQRLSTLRSLCEESLLGTIGGSWVNGDCSPRLPGTLSLTIPDVPADMLMTNLPRVCIGDGAACNSGALEPSHVLLAMGLSRTHAECTIRISLGRDSSESEIVTGCREISAAVMDLREKLADDPIL